MSQRSLAAQRFWRDLIASCTRAGEGDLDTDGMAFVTFELPLACSPLMPAARSYSPTSMFCGAI